MITTDRSEQIKYSVSLALDYIEENLSDDELSTARVASAAGYSKYHFLRIFREVCGLTPSDYIRKRRISEIVRCMRGDDRPISDIAFEYGFNSKENFIRAFKGEHGILPTSYRASDNSLRLYDRIKLDIEPLNLDGVVRELEPIRIVAYKSDCGAPPQFWNKYNTECRSARLSGGKVTLDYGVCIWNHTDKKLDYFIGIREEEAMGDTTGTVTLDIDGGLYAVFDTPPSTHFDFVNTIRSTWDYIARVWLPEHGYVRTGGYELESYTEKSRIYSEKIYIPIKKQE